MIIPLPATIQSQPGAMELRSAVVIAFEGGLAASQTATLLKDALVKRYGLQVSTKEGPTKAKGAVSLRLDKALSGLGAEGYELEVGPEGVSVRASGDAGLFYGTQSLRQLIRKNKDGRLEIPFVKVEDKPRYGFRAFMLDSSRHFQTPAFVKRLLDQMAYLKLNQLHWHLTDDQGWRVEIKHYPKLTEIGAKRHAEEPDGSGFYTQKELREIVAYAQARHINIIPEIEMPAHSAAAMASYPELTCHGKAWELGGWGIQFFVANGYGIYCAGREESFEFINNVLDEVIAIFPSPIIHVGGDERPDGIWAGCERCQAVMARENLKTESALQNWFMKRITAHVNSKGRRTMAWTPSLDHGVPENQIVDDWYTRLLAGAVKSGVDGVNSWDEFTYFDYPNFPGRQKPDWMADLAVEHVYEHNPTPPSLTASQESRILGSKSHLWTEFVEQEDVDEALFPRIIAFAEVVWSPQEKRNWPDFKKRLDAMESEFNAMGVQFALPPDKKPIKLSHPCRIETSMKHFGAHTPESAFDGKFVRSFWSAEPPKFNDHFTIWLKEPVSASRVKLFIGADLGYNDLLSDGVLEVSYDGSTFHSVGLVSGRLTVADVGPSSLQALRLRVLADHKTRLSIREILLEK